MKPLQDFTAIDFETMTSELTSACAVGVVQVINGVITQEYYTLIKPIPDSREHNNALIHGITPDMVQNVHTFDKVFPMLKYLIGNNPIVCHNKQSDIAILNACMQHYELSGIKTSNAKCTYELTEMSLVDACEHYSIEMGQHHNALDDARACTKVMLALSGKIMADVYVHDKKNLSQAFSSRKVQSELKIPLADSDVANQNTMFFHASLVITGTFDAYPDRNDLASRLRDLGADINSTISGKTTIVVMGHGAGPSKIKKIEDWIAKGHDIKIIREKELVKLLKSL